MKRIIYSLLSVVMLVTMLLPAGTPVVAAADHTDWTSPSANAGDFTNPTNAYADGGGYAQATNGKVHQYYGYGFSIPDGATIGVIQVRLDAWRQKQQSGSLDIALSWDKGITWTKSQSTGDLGQNEKKEVIISGDADTWGHNWTAPEINSGFRVRLTATTSDWVGLDWVPVTVAAACEATAPSFSVCQGTTLTKAMFIAEGAGCSGPDCCKMTLDYSGVDTSMPGDYDYTVTCGCPGGVCEPDTEPGTVTVVEACVPTAPSFSVCQGTTLTNAMFITEGAGCSGPTCCEMTLDYSGVNTSTPGDYDYTVTCECPGGVCEPDTVHGTVTVVGSGGPLLSISKTGVPDPVEAGGSLVYTISIENSGSGAADNVVVTETYDGNFAYTGAIPAPDDGTDNQWTFASIAGRETEVITITGTVLDNGETSLSNTAAYTSDSGGSGEATETTEVTPSGPLLSISKTGEPDPVRAGANVTYTINVANSGGAAATGVTVIDNYDETILTIVDADGGVDDGSTITWDGGLSIPGGNSLSFDIIASVNSTAAAGTRFYNTANVTCDEASSDSVTISTAVWSGGGGCYLKVDMLGKITWVQLTCSDHKVIETKVAPDLDNINFLELERGTKVICNRGCPGCSVGAPEVIVMSPSGQSYQAPQGKAFVGSIYDFTGYTHGERCCDAVTFDQPASLVLDYDPDNLPQFTSSLALACYDSEEGDWVELPPDTGRVAEVGKAAGLGNHFSTIAIVASVTPPPPPPAPKPAPAHFVGSGLTIEPSMAKLGGALTFVTRIGENVVIGLDLVNNGEQAGTYTVELKLNGQTVDAKEVTLGAGESQRVIFTLSGMDYGQYKVEVSGLNGEFTVSQTINWWLILAMIFGMTSLASPVF